MSPIRGPVSDPERRAFLERCLALGGALAAGGALVASGRAAGPGTAPDWTLGFRNAPADGYPPAPMRLVHGRPPAGLAGTLYRNGPAQFRYGESIVGHWFDGDGMVQALAVADGAVSHRGRFVATPKRRAEQAAGRFLAAGFGSLADPDYPVTGPDAVNAANTSVLPLGDELLALWEAGSPFRLDPDSLETLGTHSWRPDLVGMPFLAHPKREPGGRIWNLAMGGSRIGVYRIGADGALEHFELVNTGVPAYLHDWAMTERRLIVLLQPWILDSLRPPVAEALSWQPELGLRVLVLDKDDLAQRRWVQCPPRAFFHTASAWEERGGTIRVDGAFYDEPVLGAGGGRDFVRGAYEAGRDHPSRFCQLVLPPAGDGRFVDSGVGGEFPQVDPRRRGRRRELAVLAAGDRPDRPLGSAVAVVDWATGRHQSFDFGAHQIAEEHLVVPRPRGGAERDAWVIGTTLNLQERASELHVFELAAVADGPVASWRAPRAWPLGFHGAFVPA